MKNILLFLSLAFLLGACELFSEASPGLPPKTQTGENTFGCKVNGKLWLPYAERSIAQSGPLKWELGNGSFILRPVNDKSDFAKIRLHINPETPIQEGETYYFSLADSMRYLTPDSTRYFLSWGGVADYSSCNYGYPAHRSFSEGWIKVTKYDPFAREDNIGVVAGEFEYIAYPRKGVPQDPSCDTLTEPIHVTEGRFDILTIKR